MLSNHPNCLGGNGPSASSDLIGDVDGPASATDNAVARFDGTTGKLIQNSVVTIADTTGDIAGASSLTAPAATNLTLAAGSGNQNITLSPSGTGSIISSIDGTAFYPCFAVGANCGLFFASASSLGFSTGGTERARFVGSTGDFLLSSTTSATSSAGAIVSTGGVSAKNLFITAAVATYDNTNPSIAFSSAGGAIGFYSQGNTVFFASTAARILGFTSYGLSLSINGDVTNANIATDAAGASGFFAPSNGAIAYSGGGTERFRIAATTGNVGIGTTDQFGSGVKVVGIANATTAPTANPTGGGVLYVDAGALKYRGSSGTVTIIAAA